MTRSSEGKKHGLERVSQSLGILEIPQNAKTIIRHMLRLTFHTEIVHLEPDSVKLSEQLKLMTNLFTVNPITSSDHAKDCASLGVRLL